VRVIRALLAGAGISAIAVGLAVYQSASASPSPVPRSEATARASEAGTPVVTYAVSAAAQRSALAFWTPRRMAAATAVSRAQPGATANAASPETPAALIAPKGTPTAAKFPGVPTVGALFFTTGSMEHFCTASVVGSAPGDMALTAAHCVYWTGYATNIAYVPEYHSGTRPYGTWAVQAISVAAGWRTTHNPDLDFAFLTVAPLNGRRVQAVTGGLTFAINAAYAQSIEVIGYNDTDALPVRCATRSFEFRPNQQEFYCHDFRDGTSGGPWIAGFNSRAGTGVVHGVIGGYENGGDYEWASYSPHFGAAIQALYWHAEKIG
jgi:V8-like Glu-specific endopeptidase